jgi:hypothetical protein
MAHRERWFRVFENLLCYSRLPKAERHLWPIDSGAEPYDSLLQTGCGSTSPLVQARTYVLST